MLNLPDPHQGMCITLSSDLSLKWVKSIFGWVIFFKGQNSYFNYVVNFVLKMGVTFVNAWILMVTKLIL